MENLCLIFKDKQYKYLKLFDLGCFKIVFKIEISLIL